MSTAVEDQQVDEAPEEETAAVSTALARLPNLGEVAAVVGLPPDSIHHSGLELTNLETTFEEWSDWGHRIGQASRWTRFALGDWINFGEAVFGEDSAQAVEGAASERYDVAQRVTGLKPATLMNYASLCGRVPHKIRRVELDFSVHEPVAALDREDQVRWLEEAVENGWTREELRDAIKVEKNPPAEDGDAVVVDPPESWTEQTKRVLALVVHQSQPTSEGGALVPPEPWAQLRELAGEE